MFEYWSWFGLAFIGFLALGFLIYMAGNRKKRPDKIKSSPYTCGEPFEKVSIGPGNLYRAIEKSLPMGYMKKIHSGSVSDYLVWMLVGASFVMVYMVLI